MIQQYVSYIPFVFSFALIYIDLFEIVSGEAAFGSIPLGYAIDALGGGCVSPTLDKPSRRFHEPHRDQTDHRQADQVDRQQIPTPVAR
jgi:hypothetical protein